MSNELEVVENKLWSPTEGRGQVIDEHGEVVWEEDWQSNFLANEGEESILNVWMRGQANPTKWLALLTAAPTEVSTMATMTELFVPPLNGYARQEITAAEWGVPALDDTDMQSTAAEQSFGPVVGLAWTNFTHVAMVTAETGTAGKFLLALALSAATSVAVGQSFRYTLRAKVQ